MYPPKEEAYTAPAAATPTKPTTMGIPVNSNPTNNYSDMNVPAPLQIQSQAPTPWSTGLCDCCEDVGNCCLTCCCPCITFGQIAEIVDRGSMSCGASGALYLLIMLVTGCSCIYSCCYRSKMRQQYGLQESPCADCLVHCCCQSCALCQEYRELKRRGFDMTIGWDANMERQGRGAFMPPAIPGGMTR